MEKQPKLIKPFRYSNYSINRRKENVSAAVLNYFTSRIRAILRKSESSDLEGLEEWFWTGLSKELDAAMAIVGHASASDDNFLDIPMLLRGLSQNIDNEDSLDEDFVIRLSPEMRLDLFKDDPTDPTGIVEEYLHDWWNHVHEWETYSQEDDIKNLDEAFAFHVKKYGYNKSSKTLTPTASRPPEETMGNNCQSDICRNRLHSALSQVRNASRVVQSLLTKLENDRVSADRHVLHLKALEEYLVSTGKRVLTQADIQTLYEKSGVIEMPDVEMQDITGPSANQSLTSQSLSFNGFSDTDSDYIP